MRSGRENPLCFRQIVNLAKMKSEPRRAVLVSASPCHRGFSPFLIPVPPSSSRGPPFLTVPSQQLWHPLFSSLEDPCFSLLPFPFLIIQTSSPLLLLLYFYCFGWGMPFCNRNGPQRCLWLQFEKMKDPQGELDVLDESGNCLIWGNKNIVFLLTYILILLWSFPLNRNEFIFIWQFYDPNQPALPIYLI